MSPPRHHNEAWIRVYRGTGPTDPYLMRDWLERNGVPAQVRGESLMSLRGDIPVAEAWPSVWVSPNDRPRALVLVESFHGPALVYPPWTCASCGEENAPNFGSCWSCGADSPHLQTV